MLEFGNFLLFIYFYSIVDEEDVPTYSTLTPSFQKVSAESASLLELQRKRTLSSMENAKVINTQTWFHVCV